MVLYVKATKSTVVLVEQRHFYWDWNRHDDFPTYYLRGGWYQKRLIHNKDGRVCIVPCFQRVWPASLAPFVVNSSFTVSTKDGVQVDCKVSVEVQIDSSSDDKIFKALHPNYNPMWSGFWAEKPVRPKYAEAKRGFVYYLKEAVRQYLVRELMQLTHADLVAGLGKKDEEFPLSESALRAHLQRGRPCMSMSAQSQFDDSHAILRAHIDVQPAPEGPGGGGEVDGGACAAGRAYPAGTGGVAPAGIVLVDPGLAATSATKEAPHNLAIPRDTVEAWEREADELEPKCSKCDCGLASWRTYSRSALNCSDLFPYNPRGACCCSTCTCIPPLIDLACACCSQPPCPCFWVCCICNGCQDGSSAADADPRLDGSSYCHYLRSEKAGVMSAPQVAKRRLREQFLAKKHYSVCFGMDAAVGAPDIGW